MSLGRGHRDALVLPLTKRLLERLERLEFLNEVRGALEGPKEGRVVLKDIPEEMEGVGAIPLDPMGSRASLDHVISAMLA